jgi:hypothetical protein
LPSVGGGAPGATRISGARGRSRAGASAAADEIGSALLVPRETFIERIVVDRYFGRHLDRWKGERADGWDVVVLLDEASRRREVVALGCRR